MMTVPEMLPEVSGVSSVSQASLPFEGLYIHEFIAYLTPISMINHTTTVSLQGENSVISLHYVIVRRVPPSVFRFRRC